MALIDVKVRLPPNNEAEYPPDFLIFGAGDFHAVDYDSFTQFVPSGTSSSSDRYLRLEISGLVEHEVVDNIKIWCVDVFNASLSEELQAYYNRHSRIVTNCTSDTDDYYGSFTFQDAMYNKNQVLGNVKPATANVGIDGSLVAHIGRTTQPGSGITNGGFSDWILLQAVKTTEFAALPSASQDTVIFRKIIIIEWDEYLTQ